jgi:stage II sporulation protein GA (sporulation sigma-E factor processing peptidase)
MVLYLDAVWFLNLLIDACLLKLTAIMLRRRTKRIRMWMGAFVASAIVLLLFSPLAPMIGHPLGKLLFSVLIILITFGFCSFSVFFQNLAAFYFSAFALGGGLFALHYIFQFRSFYAENSMLTTLSFGDPVSWIVVAAGFPLLWYFSKKRLEQTAYRKWQATTGAELTISLSGQTIRARGLVDSGNHLRDPLTRLPVMFLQMDACRGLFPAVIERAFIENHPFELPPETGDEWKSRMTWVPYRTVDGVTNYQTTVRPDAVLIQHEGKLIECRKVLIAVKNQKLSSAGDFNCILHPDMLLNGRTIVSAS